MDMEVEEIMDDPDATHSKPIENYFGNFDRELQKTGGFQKVTDDRIIKYSKDLIEEGQCCFKQRSTGSQY